MTCVALAQVFKPCQLLHRPSLVARLAWMRYKKTGQSTDSLVRAQQQVLLPRDPTGGYNRAQRIPSIFTVIICGSLIAAGYTAVYLNILSFIAATNLEVATKFLAASFFVAFSNNSIIGTMASASDAGQGLPLESFNKFTPPGWQAGDKKFPFASLHSVA